jgi:hypothetical protein
VATGRPFTDTRPLAIKPSACRREYLALNTLFKRIDGMAVVVGVVVVVDDGDDGDDDVAGMFWGSW